MICNMGHLSEIETLFEKVSETYGKLDILVNNAAANPHFGEMTTVDEGVWQKTVNVNLKGPFFMIQRAVSVDEGRAGKGAVVNVSSANGVRPMPFQGMYSITKGAMITMTQAYAKELAPYGIRVNALVPGLTDTKFAEVLINTKEIYEMAMNLIPMRRHAEPAEMAGAVLYLVSDASSYTTGVCIPCDGGLLA